MMIPLWQLALLSFNNVEEFSFSYCEGTKIFIEGRKVSGEWCVDIRVSSPPNVIWGCNNHRTKMFKEHKEVIKYYSGMVISQMPKTDALERYKLLNFLTLNF